MRYELQSRDADFVCVAQINVEELQIGRDFLPNSAVFKGYSASSLFSLASSLNAKGRSRRRKRGRGGGKNVGLTLKKRDRVGCDRGDSGRGRYP